MAMHETTYEYLKPTDEQIACMARVRAAAKAYNDVLDKELPESVATFQPRETGTEVIAALREALGFPLKAVLMTGDTSSAIKELPRDPNLRMASKPIRADELLTLLRTLLTA